MDREHALRERPHMGRQQAQQLCYELVGLGRHTDVNSSRVQAPGPSMGMSGLRPCRPNWEGGAAACRPLHPPVARPCGSCAFSAMGCSRGDPEGALLHKQDGHI